ncbi:MAG: DNA repair protein RecN [Caldithrix sp.]|nr:DNA repair protein RecN [Caldithrix sp.]
MIKSLYVKNYALVDELKISFAMGLNIITGETGAGKSLIINALSQLGGDRSRTDLIRMGTDKAIIEAELSIELTSNVKEIANALELDVDDGEIILRKEIKGNGNSRHFINDSPVNLNVLNKLAGNLFDLHGQHQHQRLLNPEYHISYLDDYGHLEEKVNRFDSLLSNYNLAKTTLDQLKSQQLNAFQKQDMYRYQYDELIKAELADVDFDALKNELKLLENVGNIHHYGMRVVENIYNGHQNASDLLADAEESLKNLSEINEEFKELYASITTSREALEEIGRFTNQYISNLEFDNERMESLQSRIAQIEFLMKKYQKLTLQELVDYQEFVGQQLGEIEAFDDQIEEQERAIQTLTEQLVSAGKELSENRKNIARAFEERITNILKKIGMPNAEIKVEMTYKDDPHSSFVFDGKPVSVNARGFDKILFLASTNKGEIFKPLHKIVSGGEISRIMLALKSVMAEKDKIPVLIFDEIDMGISGKIAQIVGRELADLAHYHQIICVTHSAQIAAFASAHYKVLKSIQDNHTSVDIKQLDGSSTINEIAQLLGGKDVSKQAIENAKHLLEESKSLHQES